MSNERRQYSAQFKLQVVLELLKGQKSAAQIAREHNLGQDLLSRWRDLFHERGAQIFQDGRTEASAEAARIAELERLVGQQALELTILKRGCASGSAPRSGGR
jgi:transposase